MGVYVAVVHGCGRVVVLLHNTLSLTDGACAWTRYGFSWQK